jgi:hypothetical protein
MIYFLLLPSVSDVSIAAADHAGLPDACTILENSTPDYFFRYYTVIFF